MPISVGTLEEYMMPKTLRDFLHKYADEIDNVHKYKQENIKLKKKLVVTISWLEQFSQLLDEICDGPLNCPNEDFEQYFGPWSLVHEDRAHIKQFIKELKDED